MRSHLFLLTLLAGLPAAGCDPFSPNLPDRPFRCGTTDPKCPDGFTCGAGNVCERSAGGGVDAGNLNCNDDSALEPNNAISDAFPTPVAASRASVSYAQLAICPSTDIDTYQYDITTTGTNVTATMTYDASGPALQLVLLSSNGTLLQTGTDMGGQMVTATIANSPSGTYFAQVSAAPGDQNNYRLSLVTTP